VTSEIYELRCVRYVPDAVRGDFLTIGLVLFRQQPNKQAVPVGSRWTRDWWLVLAFDPTADLELVKASCQELESILQTTLDLRELEKRLGGMIQLTAAFACLSSDPHAELDELARLYLEHPHVNRTSSAIEYLENALYLLRSVHSLEPQEKDLVQQAVEDALSAIRSCQLARAENE
jgi:hypothetical protein